MAIDYLISHGSVEQAPINWLSNRPTNHWCVYELFQLNQVHGTRIVCFRSYQSWNTSACFEFGVGWGWWWWWWCIKSTSTVALFFQVFLNPKNTIYLLNITYIFDRCHRSLASLAGATVVQVECDLRDLTNIFAMMTSSNGNIFRVTGHLCGKFTGHRWISHTKASDAELWCLLWSAPEWTVE